MEKEYNFLIPKDSIAIKPESNICGFKCISTNVFNIEDVLFERKGKLLKDESKGKGLRVRKQNGSIELTYKEFLGRVDGMAKCYEKNFKLKKEEYEKFKKGNFKNCNYKIVNDLQKDGELYINMIIKNKRSLYRYEKNGNIVDLFIEDVTFIRDENSVKDAMIEIEIVKNIPNDTCILDFVETIRKTYKAIPSCCGKNVRGEELLKL